MWFILEPLVMITRLIMMRSQDNSYCCPCCQTLLFDHGQIRNEVYFVIPEKESSHKQKYSWNNIIPGMTFWGKSTLFLPRSAQ